MSLDLIAYGVPIASFAVSALSAFIAVKIVTEATKEALDTHIKEDTATHVRFGATQQEILRAIGRLEGKLEAVLEREGSDR